MHIEKSCAVEFAFVCLRQLFLEKQILRKRTRHAFVEVGVEMFRMHRHDKGLPGAIKCVMRFSKECAMRTTSIEAMRWGRRQPDTQPKSLESRGRS